jgi:hypothetical protein
VTYSPLKYLILGIVRESFDRHLKAGINLAKFLRLVRSLKCPERQRECP